MRSKQIALVKSTKEIIRRYSANPNQIMYKEPFLIESLRGLRSYTALPSERKEKNLCMEGVVRKWFSQRMTKRYNELSPEIFEVKREIEISEKHFKDENGRMSREYNNNKRKLKIPLLLHAELDKEGWEKQFSLGEYSTTYKFTLSSRIPRVPFNVRKAGKEAVVFAYRTFADALDTEVLGEVIAEHPKYAPHPENAKVLVLWKPKPSDIHIKTEVIDNDPALVLKWDNPYLVTTWTEPDEEPFMDIISACKLSNLDTFLDR